MKRFLVALIPILALGACAAAPEPASIAGKQWVAEGMGDGDPKDRPRLEFVADGRLAGFTGCNMLSGRWRQEGAEVKLEGLVATKRGCLGPGGALERRFLAAVNESARLTLEGGKLVAQGASGERLVFSRGQSPL
jgi:heat shock protein HslJ